MGEPCPWWAHHPARTPSSLRDPPHPGGSLTLVDPSPWCTPHPAAPHHCIQQLPALFDFEDNKKLFLIDLFKLAMGQLAGISKVDPTGYHMGLPEANGDKTACASAAFLADLTACTLVKIRLTGGRRELPLRPKAVQDRQQV